MAWEPDPVLRLPVGRVPDSPCRPWHQYLARVRNACLEPGIDSWTVCQVLNSRLPVRGESHVSAHVVARNERHRLCRKRLDGVGSLGVSSFHPTEHGRRVRPEEPLLLAPLRVDPVPQCLDRLRGASESPAADAQKPSARPRPVTPIQSRPNSATRSDLVENRHPAPLSIPNCTPATSGFGPTYGKDVAVRLPPAQESQAIASYSGGVRSGNQPACPLRGTSPVARGRLAIHSWISSATQATDRGPSFTGIGNVPICICR